MKQTAKIISTYASDTSGVCSALYELGGMCIMHDASGCNSTYGTHDEPRWYDMDSMVYISAITETEAILGDDDKLISDIKKAAEVLNPKFIAIAGTPIPTMTGVDIPAIAHEIQEDTGIISFGIPTDGMHSYVRGADLAFEQFAEKVCSDDEMESDELSVNILGVTPLDFSINGSDISLREKLEKNNIKVNSVWAMNDTYENMIKAKRAKVNLVVSSCAMRAAKVLEKRFNIPYVVGTLYGEEFSDNIIDKIKLSSKNKENYLPKTFANDDVVIIGEGVTSLSLANALYYHSGYGANVICATDIDDIFIGDGFVSAIDEDEIIPHLEKAKIIIADKMYKPICPEGAKFVNLPHEAFSGRIYRKEIPNLVENFNEFVRRYLE